MSVDTSDEAVELSAKLCDGVGFQDTAKKLRALLAERKEREAKWRELVALYPPLVKPLLNVPSSRRRSELYTELMGEESEG